MTALAQQKTLLSLSMAIAIVFSAHAPAAKEVYKWQDTNGAIHYTEQKPLNNDKVTKVRTTNIAGDSEGAKQLDSRVKEHNRKRKEAAAVAVPPSAKNPERCAAAKKNLKTLNENARVKVKEGKSSRFLSQDEYQEQKRITLQQIKEAC